MFKKATIYIFKSIVRLIFETRLEYTRISFQFLFHIADLSYFFIFLLFWYICARELYSMSIP